MRLPFELERRQQDPHEIAGDLCGARGIGPRQQHREFVTAQSGHQIRRPQRALEALPDLLEQGVADPMAQGVVDFLEPIQVQKH